MICRELAAAVAIAGLLWASAVLAHAPSPRREIVDLVCQDEDLIEIVARLNRQVGERVVVLSPDIHQKVTLALHNKPWHNAAILLAKRALLDFEERGPLVVLTEAPRITIQVGDANVRTILQLIGNYSGKRVLTCPEFHGELTIDVHDVPWRKAFHAIVRVQPGDFDVIEEDDLLRVVRASSIASAR